jgi:hypothetical protein
MPYQTYKIFLNIYNESKKRKEKENEKQVPNKPSEKKKIDTWEIYKILR